MRSTTLTVSQLRLPNEAKIWKLKNEKKLKENPLSIIDYRFIDVLLILQKNSTLTSHCFTVRLSRMSNVMDLAVLQVKSG